MPVAGLVIQLANEQPLARAALDRLAQHQAFTLGNAPVPGRVPVVMESHDEDHSRQQLRWLERLAGVTSVLVVSVDCSDLAADAAPSTIHPPPGADKGVASS